MSNEISMPANPTSKKDMISIYLSISLSALILLWLFAMDFFAVFDSIVAFIAIVCVVTGIARGGVKEFFGFFGILASLVFAISFYKSISQTINFDFGTGNDIWGELVWFSILLGISGTVCFLLKRYLEKKVEGVSSLETFNALLGMVIGFLKGIICGYFLIVGIMITGVAYRGVSLERQMEGAFSYQVVNTLEQQYGILENLSKMELAQRLSQFHEKNRMQQITVELFPEDKSLQNNSTEFLVWLAKKPTYLSKLQFAKEARKIYKKFMQIPEAKKFIENDIDIQNLKKQKKEITIFHICEILRKPETIKLIQHESIIRLLTAVDVNKIKSEIEEQK